MQIDIFWQAKQEDDFHLELHLHSSLLCYPCDHCHREKCPAFIPTTELITFQFSPLYT
jgi:hypothetical protein